MKKMVITGLSNEQDFLTGEAKYVLLLNGGELRIDITEEAANLVIQKMYEEPTQPASNIEQGDQKIPMASGPAWVGNNSQDEDGIDQV